jgi:hypothetical protein
MNITLAKSIKSGSHQELLGRAERCAEIIRNCWQRLCRDFDFDPDVELHLRPIPGAFLGKSYQPSSVGGEKYRNGRIELDPRCSEREFLETLAHEITHFEQYKHGRLKLLVSDDRLRGVEYVWNGQRSKAARCYQEYLDSPWEIEARQRAAAFVRASGRTVTHWYRWSVSGNY